MVWNPFNLPHLVSYACVVWVVLFILNDLEKQTNTRIFLTLISFYLYMLIYCLVGCGAGLFMLPKVKSFLPPDSPYFIIAATTGLVGAITSLSIFQFSFQIMEGVDIGIFKEPIGKFRLSLIADAIKRKAAYEKWAGDEIAELIAMSTSDVPALEAKYLEMVGDTVQNPDGPLAKAAREKIAQFKQHVPQRLAHHMARGMVYVDIIGSAQHLKRLYWLKADSRRYARWILKGGKVELIIFLL